MSIRSRLNFLGLLGLWACAIPVPAPPGNRVIQSPQPPPPGAPVTTPMTPAATIARSETSHCHFPSFPTGGVASNGAGATGAQSTACQALPAGAVGSFRKMFRDQARAGDATGRARLDFGCVVVGSTPHRLWALQVFGHHGTARLVAMQARPDGGFQTRTMRADMDADDDGDATGHRVAFFRTDVSAPTVQAAFDIGRAAVAARVTIGQQPFDAAKGLRLDSITTSSANVLIELHVMDGQGRRTDRAFAGNVGSMTFPDRVPLEIAWRALEYAARDNDVRAASLAQPEDRDLLRDAWWAQPTRPEFAEQALLALAADAGDPAIIPLVTPGLDSRTPHTQALAVNALAAITGWDVRRDAAGKPRPLADVVADYHRECAASPAVQGSPGLR